MCKRIPYITACALIGAWTSLAWAADLPVFGWLEHVVVETGSLDLIAKLDSGAKTSSIHAEKLEYFRKQEREWVRFELTDRKSRSAVETRRVQIELPIVRTTKIKHHGGDSTTRPVVELPICLGGKTYEAEFTLENRRNFNYPVLLGRGFLANVLLINPGKTHLGEASRAACAARAGTSQPH